jgi:hypothetical protein
VLGITLKQLRYTRCLLMFKQTITEFIPLRSAVQSSKVKGKVVPVLN